MDIFLFIQNGESIKGVASIIRSKSEAEVKQIYELLSELQIKGFLFFGSSVYLI
jgi:hypothetical protein